MQPGFAWARVQTLPPDTDVRIGGFEVRRLGGPSASQPDLREAGARLANVSRRISISRPLLYDSHCMAYLCGVSERDLREKRLYLPAGDVGLQQLSRPAGPSHERL